METLQSSEQIPTKWDNKFDYLKKINLNPAYFKSIPNQETNPGS